jgi:hypothetical protein
MTSWSKMVKTGLVAALLLAGISTGARGQVPPGGSSLRGELRGPVHITGKVICVRCSL